MRERIFISRQKANHRRIKNFGHVKRILESVGFETYVLEDMSFQNQVDLFSRAKHIVSAHGAGLTNLIFSPRDTSILEIMPSAENSSHFFRLSRMLNMKYYNIVSDKELDNRVESFTVSVNGLMSKIDEMV